MINWIKGHLKVLDSVRSAGEVSVSNLGSGHSLSKPLMTRIGFKCDTI